jgi:hypothetical protein
MEGDGAVAAGAAEQVTEQLYATREVLLRAPLVGRHRTHRHPRIGAISDIQSGAKVFRLLGTWPRGTCSSQGSSRGGSPAMRLWVRSATATALKLGQPAIPCVV